VAWRKGARLSPNTHYLAVRTSNRYGKTSLTARHGRESLAGVSPSATSISASSGPDGTHLAAERVGLITFKDCKAASPVRSASRRTARATSPGCAKASRSRTATYGTVFGTPTLRPEDVARLARAYYHSDPHVIDETSVCGEDGRWHYRDARMQCVADALTRAELTQCAHRNRPLRYDGRVVVTLCAEDMHPPTT
jgi:hypothetical protein